MITNGNRWNDNKLDTPTVWGYSPDRGGCDYGLSESTNKSQIDFLYKSLQVSINTLICMISYRYNSNYMKSRSKLNVMESGRHLDVMESGLKLNYN